MAKCPFMWLEKECSPECALYVETVREFDNGDTKIVKGCVFVLDHDERRNQTQRIAMLQSEMGETKNATIYQAIATLTDAAGAKAELRKAISNHFDQKKLGR